MHYVKNAYSQILYSAERLEDALRWAVEYGDRTGRICIVATVEHTHEAEADRMEADDSGHVRPMTQLYSYDPEHFELEADEVADGWGHGRGHY